MKKFFSHLHTVNVHRFEVFKLCVKVGIPFRGLMHDLSKYSYTEMSESIKYYTDGKVSPLKTCKQDIGYSKAWLHHKGRNKHHFEYWYDNTARLSMPIIPFKYMLEMICDRIAATKVYNKKNYNNKMPYDYFMKGKDHYVLNDNLKAFLEEVFTKLYEEGEIILNKKTLKKMYIKHTNKKTLN